MSHLYVSHSMLSNSVKFGTVVGMYVGSYSSKN